MPTVGWLDALRGTPSPRRAGLALVGVAALLYGVVLALLLASSRPGSELLVLLCLPVSLLAVSFGRVAGVVAAGVALLVTGLWDLLGGTVGGVLGYVACGTAFVLLGFLAGWLSERLMGVQQALRDSAAELEEAQHLARIGSWSWSAATDRLTLSPELLALAGLDPAVPELQREQALRERLHPDDVEEALEVWARALRVHAPFESHQRLLLPDGTVRHVLNRGQVVLDDGGRVVGMRGSTQDVTVLRQAELRAQSAHERLSAMLASMLDAVTVGSAVRDGEGRIVDFRLEYANDAAAALYGLPAADLVGRRWLELWRGSVDDASFAAFVRLVETGEPVQLQDQRYDVAGADGTVSGVIDYHATRFGDGYVATWRDVSDRHRAQSAVAAAGAKFAAAFDHAPVGMVLLDAERTVLRANAAFGALLGIDLDALTGTSLDALMDPRDLAGSREDFARLLSGGDPAYHRERRLVTSAGEARWVSVSVGRVDSADGVAVVEHFEDVHDRKGWEGRLQHQADHDALTGLFNRRRFREELAHQLALDRRYGQTSSLVLLDLDNFKYINDTLGHPTGDRLLQVIGEALSSRLRDSDVIGRLGGDEFAVLLPETDELKATMVTASLLVGISDSEVEHAGQRVRSTGSAGVARLDTTTATDPDEVLSNADLAMYAAKEAGRNTYVVYDPDGPHAARSQARFRWLDRVRHALEHNQFTLVAEPILDLDRGEITGCELLLRMRHDGHLVEPVEFLTIAERHGLGSTIDRYVIEHAMELVAATPRPDGFRWEVNLSADSLTDPEIPGLIERSLARTGISPDVLVFEITETAAITNMEQALAFAERLRDIGCRFALDDFGAGYGSFYYLKHLPFAYLKIDGEFIRDLATSPTDRAIVRAIVGAARELGKQTIAEYVGDDATLALLRRFGVDHAQGHHIGRAADPALPLVAPP